MDLASGLRDLVGDKYVLHAPDAEIVVKPGDTEQVAAVVAWCCERGVPLVPRGGNTGLAGGSLADEGSVLVALERLNEIAPIDAGTGTVVAGAGVTLEALDDRVVQEGLFFPVDHAARSAATVGGTVATNAGGAIAWRFGMARTNVVALEVVLAGGRVVGELERPLKNNSGLDLTGLLCGSEGTLGIVTRARLRLVPALPHRVTALVAAGSPDQIADLFIGLRDRCPSLVACDFLSRDALEFARSFAELPAAPFDAAVYLVVECGDEQDPTEELVAALAELRPEHDAVARDSAERRRLWAYRELLNDASTAAHGHKMDIALPIDGLGDFLAGVDELIADVAPSARAIWFGHGGDGNVHLNVLDAAEETDAIEDRVYREVAARGGAISAEHGIGRLKTRWLELARSRDEIEAIRAIKQALDPTGMMNPGVMITR